MISVSQVCEKEIAVYDKVISLLEWRAVPPRGELFSDFLPVIASGKRLVRLDPKGPRVNFSTHITFRPLRNAKHCQYVIERLFEEDEAGLDLLLSKTEEGHSARIVDPHGENLFRISGCETETEAKFWAAYGYFFGDEDDVPKIAAEIREFDAKLRKELKERDMNENRKGKKGPRR